jgi:hypothetical protein
LITESKANTIISWALPVFILVFFLVQINLKVLPLTEGWWETYAWLSSSLSLYEDVRLALPPLFTNVIYWIQKFTDQILVIRWILVLIYLINVYLIYYFCKQITNSNFAIIGTFVSQILIINNNPVWLSKDYHTLVSLLVTLFLITQYKLVVQNKNYVGYSALLGIITSLLILTKQNIALVCFISALLTIVFNKEINVKNIFISSIAYLGFLFFSLLIYSHFYGFNWVDSYMDNDSKGRYGTVIFRFISDPEIAKISVRAIVIFLIFIFLFYLYKNNITLANKIRIRIHEFFNQLNNYLKINISFVGYFILTAILYFLIIKAETTIFYSLIIAYFLINLYCYLFTNLKKQFYLLSIAFLFLAYAGTMTAGYNNVSLEILIAVFMTVLFLKLSKVFDLKQLLVTVIVSIFAATVFFNNKYNNYSYNWWGYSTDSIKNSIYFSNNKKLNGISLDYPSKQIIDATDSLVATMNPGETIFAYPSIPFFYYLYDKKPIVKSIVQWFDVMPSVDTDTVISDLGRASPKYIFWLKPPQFVYQGHLRMKKTQLPMNVIDNYLDGEIQSGKYRIIKTIPIIHGQDEGNSRHFEKYLLRPVEYEFFCNSCSNLNLNSLLAKGAIIGYSKNLGIGNSDLLNIKFKNKFEAANFVSEFNLLPLKQEDWIFYVLQKN